MSCFVYFDTVYHVFSFHTSINELHLIRFTKLSNVYAYIESKRINRVFCNTKIPGFVNVKVKAYDKHMNKMYIAKLFEPSNIKVFTEFISNIPLTILDRLIDFTSLKEKVSLKFENGDYLHVYGNVNVDFILNKIFISCSNNLSKQCRQMLDFNLRFPLVLIDSITARHDLIETFIKNVNTDDLLEKMPKNDICAFKRTDNIRNEIEKLENVLKYLKDATIVIDTLGGKGVMIGNVKAKLNEIQPLIDCIRHTIDQYPIQNGKLLKGRCTRLDLIHSNAKSKFRGSFFDFKENTFVVEESVSQKPFFEYVLLRLNKSKKVITNSFLMNLGNEFTVLMNEINKSFLERVEEIYTMLCNFSNEIQYIKNEVTKLEVANASAQFCKYYDLNRPTLNKNKIFEIKELNFLSLVTNKAVTRNNVTFTENKPVKLVRGLNASGKSTFSMGIVYTILLNQSGLFVPCSRANLPIFDSLLVVKDTTDNVFAAKSTFINHIVDVSHCLNVVETNSSKNHFIYFDELCSCTNNKEGRRLFYKIVNYMTTKKNLRSILTTHYTEENNKYIEELYSNNEYVISEKKPVQTVSAFDFFLKYV